MPNPDGSCARAPLLARPEAVIFDMDGLMLDTEPLALRAWSEAAAALGVEFDGALALALVGRNWTDCTALVEAHYGAGYPVEALLGSWHATYDTIVERDGLAVKPGLRELIDWLAANAIPRAVATSTRRERAKSKLAVTALLGHFDALVGGDDVARGKPAPDIFEEAARRLGVDCGHCLVLEDSEPGVRAALAAGMPTIMVPDLHRPSAEIAAACARVLPTLGAVLDHLVGLPAR